MCQARIVQQVCQARIVQEFMDENQIVHMDWPAQSPDLNIIKNICLKIKPHFVCLFAVLAFALHLFSFSLIFK